MNAQILANRSHACKRLLFHPRTPKDKREDSPEVLHHAITVNAELLSVLDGHTLEGETPSHTTRAEADSTLGRVDLYYHKQMQQDEMKSASKKNSE
jgi:hypothetical protein